MNLDELKTAWQVYDSRLAATEEINRKLLINMIRERSTSRISEIKRRYAQLMCLFLFYSVFLLFFIGGNVFDYTSIIEYLPLAALIISCVLMVVFLISARFSLNKTALSSQNLQGALEQTIVVYVRYRKNLRYIVRTIFLCATFVSLFHILNSGSKSGLLVGIVLVLFYFAVMAGVYFFFHVKKRSWWNKEEEDEQSLRADLEELNELN